MRSRKRREGGDNVKISEVRGIIPPIITPMDNDAEQSVNYAELRNRVNRFLAGGVRGTFPTGMNDKVYALSLAECEEIFATAIDEVCGRVPVYAGTGRITTADTTRLSGRAEELDADVPSAVTLSFVFASQKELYDHYVTVVKEVHIPIIPYSIPAWTGNKLLPETI